VCRNLILPEICIPCPFLSFFEFAQFIVPYHLVKLDDGYLMIDTGYQKDYEGFLKKIKKRGIALAGIKYIFLTHAHDDHAGFLNELLDNTNAKLILSELAVERLKTGMNPDGKVTSRGAVAFFKLLWFMASLGLVGKKETYPVVDRADRYIVINDDTRQMLEGVLSAAILDLPGHTKDSVGLLFKDGSLFCGDTFINGYPSINKITIVIEDFEGYKKSWDTIKSCKASLIYPGHGKPFPASELGDSSIVKPVFF
jgi:glyoxylase-like metal-dependent hydrolase (beta-lactamase superfamily II)